jgi:peptidoglycan/LPS O-acetylase OafA/YrhL
VFVYTAVVALAAWAVSWAAVRPWASAWVARWPMLAWAGRISYSGYLVHTLVIWTADQAGGRALLAPLGSVGSRVAFFVVVAALTLAFAHLMYRWVEQPAIRWTRRRLGSHGPLKGPAVQAAR